ncbi:unnamed protein product [Callosobruchus maculatus]|uniref:Uncharacterized protein n=1 Tax=Callosobruchus maculatus TaxID=64391 RepID=A0A653D0L3_CALMS|nr:unnamed protein product [Callosobruchus maculatus]
MYVHVRVHSTEVAVTLYIYPELKIGSDKVRWAYCLAQNKGTPDCTFDLRRSFYSAEQLPLIIAGEDVESNQESSQLFVPTTLQKILMGTKRPKKEAAGTTEMSEELEPRGPPTKKMNIVALKKLNNTQIESLICEVQCRSSLWNDKDSNFKNTTLTRKLWDEVGAAFEMSGDQTKKK